MKKIIGLGMCLTVICCMFAGCSKDDTESKTNEAKNKVSDAANTVETKLSDVIDDAQTLVSDAL